jgi:hypothetical protein
MEPSFSYPNYDKGNTFVVYIIPNGEVDVGQALQTMTKVTPLSDWRMSRGGPRYKGVTFADLGCYSGVYLGRVQVCKCLTFAD